MSKVLEKEIQSRWLESGAFKLDRLSDLPISIGKARADDVALRK